MEEMTNEKRSELTDHIGEVIIKEARDSSLGYAMRIAKNQMPKGYCLEERFKSLSTLSEEQQEAVCDLASFVITDTIYSILEAFENNPDRMELIIIKDGQRYNMADVSWKMGSEIACYEDEGWIQKFSKLGRFVL